MSLRFVSFQTVLPNTLANSSLPSVQSYYDRNTLRFIKRGQNQGTFNIHQPLWMPGVDSVTEAVNVSNQLVLQELTSLAAVFPQTPLHVLDLGCGVGSSLFYLAEQRSVPMRGTGISISPVQIELAEQFREQHASGHDCTFLQGDFLDLPSMPPVHLAYAIEAFLHAQDADRFFQQVAQRLVPGGKLILIDDFLTPKGAEGKLSQQQVQYLADFRSGWLAGSLLPESSVAQKAAQAGLRLCKSQNLTPFMKLGRPRDRLIGLMRFVAAPYMRKSLYFRALNGGYAKQQCLKQGLVEYRISYWEKSS